VFWDTVLAMVEPTSDADCQAGLSGLPWVYDSDAAACVPPANSGPSCTSFAVGGSTPYKFVRGQALGVQIGELCAFGPLDRYDGTGLTQTLDGEGLLLLLVAMHAAWC
jgi:hypothetical protein